LQELVNVLAPDDRHNNGNGRADMALTKEEQSLLSGRELEVLSNVARGSGTAEIAKTLFISPHTVRNHLKAIYKKLAVSSRTALMKKLLRPQ
jgi:DNA-binding NarL/FixJ family response regulator